MTLRSLFPMMEVVVVACVYLHTLRSCMTTLSSLGTVLPFTPRCSHWRLRSSTAR